MSFCFYSYLVRLRVGQSIEEHLVIVFGRVRQREHVTKTRVDVVDEKRNKHEATHEKNNTQRERSEAKNRCLTITTRRACCVVFFVAHHYIIVSSRSLSQIPQTRI